MKNDNGKMDTEEVFQEKKIGIQIYIHNIHVYKLHLVKIIQTQIKEKLDFFFFPYNTGIYM